MVSQKQIIQFNNQIAVFKKIRWRSQISLPIILIISGIFIEIAIAGAFIVSFMVSSGQGERLSARAFTVAEAGVKDAFIKITRDKNFTPSINPYTLTVNDDLVSVTVERDPIDLPTGSYRITAVGTAGTRQRKLIGILSVNNLTGKVELQSIEELKIP